MSIQSTVNQGISLASMLIGMNPLLKSAQEKSGRLYTLEKQKKAQEKAAGTLLSKLGETPEGSVNPIVAEDIEKFGDQAIKTREELFELDPSEERYLDIKEAQAYKEGGTAIKSAQDAQQSILKAKADAAAAQKMEQQRLHESRLATLGISDKPTYPVRTETEPSGYQRSFPLTTAEREPMYPELQRKGGKR